MWQAILLPLKVEGRSCADLLDGEQSSSLGIAARFIAVISFSTVPQTNCRKKHDASWRAREPRGDRKNAATRRRPGRGHAGRATDGSQTTTSICKVRFSHDRRRWLSVYIIDLHWRLHVSQRYQPVHKFLTRSLYVYGVVTRCRAGVSDKESISYYTVLTTVFSSVVCTCSNRLLFSFTATDRRTDAVDVSDLFVL